MATIVKRSIALMGYVYGNDQDSKANPVPKKEELYGGGDLVGKFANGSSYHGMKKILNFSEDIDLIAVFLNSQDSLYLGNKGMCKTTEIVPRNRINGGRAPYSFSENKMGLNLDWAMTPEEVSCVEEKYVRTSLTRGAVAFDKSTKSLQIGFRGTKAHDISPDMEKIFGRNWEKVKEKRRADWDANIEIWGKVLPAFGNGKQSDMCAHTGFT